MEGESRRYSRMLSSFSYGKIKAYFVSRGYRQGVEVHQINPAYSSVIGRVKFMERYGLTVHQAAALVLARRLLGCSERIPRRWVCPIGNGVHVAQRARGYGSAHGPERAPTHEIERQGRWKQGRRHGGLLHPRLVRRVGVSPWSAPRPTPGPRAPWWPLPPAAMGALSAIRPAGAGAEARVFELSESQIARRVKAIAKAVGLADWEFFSGHSGRVGMARRMAQNALPPTRSNAKAAGNRAGGMVGSCTRV